MVDERIEALRWRVHGERPVYENRWVRLTLVDVEPPSGDRFEHHVVRLQRVALAVVLDHDDRVLMMWRHRFATDEWGCAYRHATDYDLVWWVPAEQPALVVAALAELAAWIDVATLGEAKESADAAVRLLRRRDRFARWLVVTDNAGAPSDLAGLLTAAGGGGHVLVTSRDPAWTQTAQTVEVDVLPRAEAVALLHARSGSRPVADVAARAPRLTDGEAGQLAVLLGDLPLALEQAGAWLASSGMSAADYADALDGPQRPLPAVCAPSCAGSTPYLSAAFGGGGGLPVGPATRALERVTQAGRGGHNTAVPSGPRRCRTYWQARHMSRDLLLWDVDHTLIENGGVSKENYAHAFMLLTGRPAEQQPQTDGRTDIGIMERLLQANDVNPALYPWAAQASSLIEAGEHNRTALASRGHALPGAAAILARLSTMPNVVQSVLTGNILENARVKLAAFGLDKWIDFTVGGFGSESSVRGELVRVAQGKAADKYGVDPAQDVTVVVGDTPLDVEAGLMGGARVIGLAYSLLKVSKRQGLTQPWPGWPTVRRLSLH